MMEDFEGSDDDSSRGDGEEGVAAEDLVAGSGEWADPMDVPSDCLEGLQELEVRVCLIAIMPFRHLLHAVPAVLLWMALVWA